MNTQEGIRRVILAGKSGLLVGATLAVVSLALAVLGINVEPLNLIGIGLGVYIANFGGMVWALGWILEGFAAQ